MNSIDKAIIKMEDFRSAKNYIGDQVVQSCSGMIILLQAIRDKASKDKDESNLYRINQELIKANNIISKL